MLDPGTRTDGNADEVLLRQYVLDGSPPAFAELVQRSAGLVFSAAMRQVRDSHLAEDITQAVFLLLVRKAATVRGPLVGWLLKTTWYACRDARKLVHRRQYHERQAAKMDPRETRTAQEPAWEMYAQILDQGMMALRPADRDAVALRYLKGLNLRDVGRSLGIGEEAARKRVDRAIGRLRDWIGSVQGVAPTALALAGAMLERGAQPAPADLVQGIVAGGTGALAGGSAPAIADTVAKAMAWMRLKLAGGVLVSIGLAAAVMVGAIHALAPSPPPSSRSTAASQPAVATQPAAALRSNEGWPAGGCTMVCRWTALVDVSLADQIRAGATVLSRPGAVVEVVDADADSVRRAIADELKTMVERRSLGISLKMETQVEKDCRDQAARAANAQERRLLLDAADKAAARLDDVRSKLPPGKGVVVLPELLGSLEWDLGQRLANTGAHSFWSGNDATYPFPGRDVADVQIQGRLELSSFGDYLARPTPRGARLNFRSQQGELRNGENSVPCPIDLDAEVGVGRAAVFLFPEQATVGGRARILGVAEVLRVPAVEMPWIEAYRGPFDGWVAATPRQLISQYAAGAAWERHAQSNPPPPAPQWTHTLPHGASVTLAAISRADRYPYCWWNPAGQPVAVGLFLSRVHCQRTLAVKVVVTEPGVQFRVPNSWNGHGPPVQDALTAFQAFDQVPGELTIGFGGGVWTDQGRIDIDLAKRRGDAWYPDASTRIGQATYKLTHIFASTHKSPDRPGSLSVTMEYTDLPDVEVTLGLVDKAGKEILADPNPDVRFAQPQAGAKPACFSRTAWMDTNDLDYVMVKTRPRQWTTFRSFALEPALTPRQVASLPVTRPTPPSTHPTDAATPEGAVRLYAQALRAGDMAKLRAMVHTTDAVEEGIAASLLRVMLAGSRLSEAVERRFPGEGPAVWGVPGVVDLVAPDTWQAKVDGDKATIHGGRSEGWILGSPLVKVGAVWKLDARFGPEEHAEMKRLAAVLERWVELLEETAARVPAMSSVDEARAALAGRMEYLVQTASSAATQASH